MKKFSLKLYWNLAPVLPFLFVALIGVPLAWKELSPQTFYDLSKVVIYVPMAIIFMLIPLQILLPPDFSSWWYLRMVRKNRLLLAKRGLTPEQYLDTLPNDLMVQARARVKLGL